MKFNDFGVPLTFPVVTPAGRKMSYVDWHKVTFMGYRMVCHEIGTHIGMNRNHSGDPLTLRPSTNTDFAQYFGL